MLPSVKPSAPAVLSDDASGHDLDADQWKVVERGVAPKSLGLTPTDISVPNSFAALSLGGAEGTDDDKDDYEYEDVLSDLGCRSGSPTATPRSEDDDHHIQIAIEQAQAEREQLAACADFATASGTNRPYTLHPGGLPGLTVTNCDNDTGGFCIGTRVRVEGLNRREELNDLCGTIVSLNDAKERCGVRLDPGPWSPQDPISIRLCNLRPWHLDRSGMPLS